MATSTWGGGWPGFGEPEGEPGDLRARTNDQEPTETAISAACEVPWCLEHADRQCSGPCALWMCSDHIAEVCQQCQNTMMCQVCVSSHPPCHAAPDNAMPRPWVCVECRMLASLHPSIRCRACDNAVHGHCWGRHTRNCAELKRDNSVYFKGAPYDKRDVLVLPDSEYLCPQCEGVVWTRAARRQAVTCLECFRTYCSLSCCLKHWPLDDPELRCAPPPSPPPRWRRLCEQWPACNFFAAGICAGKCTRSLCVQHIVGPCMQCALEPLCEACLRMHCCETRDWTGCILSIADPSATGGVPQSADPSATGGVPQPS